MFGEYLVRKADQGIVNLWSGLSRTRPVAPGGRPSGDTASDGAAPVGVPTGRYRLLPLTDGRSYRREGSRDTTS
jgi:hypothetical protein